jgi:D-alanyl-D-alanine carboxypeptidase/D-alanyl-D-alanine-endopeptidase (penicillin-binding protein 4)
MYDAMKKVFFSLSFIIGAFAAPAQISDNKISKAYKEFENDEQLKGALVSLYVVDGKTDSVIFEKNAFTGMAPASTQKIITSATAYEFLGKDFHYTTDFGLISNNRNVTSFYIKGSGDPTLGSWRWNQTNEKAVLKNVLEAVRKSGIRTVHSIVVDQSGWESGVIPDGWIWQDVGNYFGAVADNLNWRENQYDIVFRSGKIIGDSAQMIAVRPPLYKNHISSQVTAAEKGTGDNTIIYLPFIESDILIKGTIPVEEKEFIVSGSIPSGARQLGYTIADSLSKIGHIRMPSLQMIGSKNARSPVPDSIHIIYRNQSPDMDSIMYWFLKKSINLYGEALVKTIAFHNNESASTENGVAILKKFWTQKGIDPSELHLVDGSGLSPVNRVTTHAQVTILKYARKQPWFNGFYNAFPEYNGMKMKSGTIGGVKGYCGYHTSVNGHEYIFSLLVNNYSGSTASIVQKMYHLLDVLK